MLDSYQEANSESMEVSIVTPSGFKVSLYIETKEKVKILKLVKNE